MSPHGGRPTPAGRRALAHTPGSPDYRTVPDPRHHQPNLIRIASWRGHTRISTFDPSPTGVRDIRVTGTADHIIDTLDHAPTATQPTRHRSPRVPGAVFGDPGRGYVQSAPLPRFVRTPQETSL
ncbi:hypothetical protein [Nocardia brevicatena]|uniref:hypothetical protein n=1 Tax=Nocardia brevicatena TaxID=37327 RepID=UPI0002D43231|nr:hypothetical protein [Nocardia brevicatena]